MEHDGTFSMGMQEFDSTTWCWVILICSCSNCTPFHWRSESQVVCVVNMLVRNINVVLFLVCFCSSISVLRSIMFCYQVLVLIKKQ